MKFGDEPSTLTIGPGTLIREHVTISPGTARGHMTTKVGANCFLMIGSHIAHDCEIGDNVMLYHHVTLGTTGWWKDMQYGRKKRHPTI